MVGQTDEARAAIKEVVANIPRGRVSTYGAVARRAGWPRHARLVARILADLPDSSDLPWYRVVASGGRIALPEGSRARREQIERLGEEGVSATDGRVDLCRFGQDSPAGDMDRWLWRVGDEN